MFRLTATTATCYYTVFFILNTHSAVSTRRFQIICLLRSQTYYTHNQSQRTSSDRKHLCAADEQQRKTNFVWPDDGKKSHIESYDTHCLLPVKSSAKTFFHICFFFRTLFRTEKKHTHIHIHLWVRKKCGVGLSVWVRKHYANHWKKSTNQQQNRKIITLKYDQWRMNNSTASHNGQIE